MDSSIQPDYSADIDTLERLSEGEEFARTAGELFDRLENPYSIKFLLENADKIRSDQRYFDNGEYPFENEDKILKVGDRRAKNAITDLKLHNESRESVIEEGKKHGLGIFGFLPGLSYNPVEAGYESAGRLEDLSSDKLEGIATGETAYSTPLISNRKKLGGISMFGGLGAMGANVAEALIQPEMMDLAGGDGFTTAVGSAGYMYGLLSLRQSNFYQEGIQMRAEDEYIEKEIEEIMDEYSDWRIYNF